MTTMLAQTLGFFTLLGVLFAGFIIVLKSTNRQVQKQDAAASEILKTKEELEQKAGTLDAQITELRQELALKNQMLEGMRGQYEEMEKDYEKLRLKLEQEATAPKISPQTSPVASPQTHPESGSPLINII
jgi:peptidoglycan hydrolase CwlO-like protein